MPLPTFQQDPQPQSGHLLNIVKGIGQLLGKDKLRENPNAPASDWRTKQPINSDPSYKEDWWDTIYGNRGQAANKSIQMDALERKNALDEDTELRRRNISDIGQRSTATTDANNAAALANIRAGREQESATMAEGSNLAKDTWRNLQSTARNLNQTLATQNVEGNLANRMATAKGRAHNDTMYTDMLGAEQSANLDAALAKKYGNSTAKITSEAVDSATTMGADSIARNALTGIQAADQMGLSALDRAKAQNAFTKSDEFAPLQAGALRSSLLSPTAAYENTLSETDRNKASVNAMQEGTELERQKLNEQLYPLPVGTALVNKSGRGYEQRDNKIKAFNAAPRPVGALTPEEIQARSRKQGTDATTGMQSNGKGGWR